MNEAAVIATEKKRKGDRRGNKTNSFFYLSSFLPFTKYMRELINPEVLVQSIFLGKIKDRGQIKYDSMCIFRNIRL